MEISLEEIGDLLETIYQFACLSVEVKVGDVRVAVRRKINSDSEDEERLAAGPRQEFEDGSVGNGVSKFEFQVSEPPTQRNLPDYVEFDSLDTDLAFWFERESRGDVSIIRAPMLGLFYRAPEPFQSPLIEVGSMVKEGRVVCMVKVMKLFQPVTAEFSGLIEAIFPEDGCMVEYGEPLIAIGRVASSFTFQKSDYCTSNEFEAELSLSAQLSIKDEVQ